MGKRQNCAACARPAEGEFSIHRDGFGEGPEVPLCNDCGGHELPSCEQIWRAIAERRRDRKRTRGEGLARP